jgi:hypothetical protein
MKGLNCNNITPLLYNKREKLKERGRNNEGKE